VPDFGGFQMFGGFRASHEEDEQDEGGRFTGKLLAKWRRVASPNQRRQLVATVATCYALQFSTSGLDNDFDQDTTYMHIIYEKQWTRLAGSKARMPSTSAGKPPFPPIVTGFKWLMDS